ncbi:MAG: nucleotide exchange factor GrpE [Ignavibacteria bacterium]|nr:nucleotide exchange factor GrpE [Ignavibacteria bacterium]
MENGTEKKSTKPTGNRTKDIYNTYLKSESGRAVPTTKKIVEPLESNLKERELSEDEKLGTELKASSEQSILEIEQIKAENEALRAKIEEIEKEKAELYDQLLRKAAEFENFRRRTQKEKEDIIKYSNEKLLYEFLTILDDLSNAVISAKQTEDFTSLAEGVELILHKTKRLFEQAGVTEIECPVGKPFDVEYHEALMTMPSQLPEGYVVQELQKGYKFFDKILRHTKVITSAGGLGSDGTMKNENVE